VIALRVHDLTPVRSKAASGPDIVTRGTALIGCFVATGIAGFFVVLATPGRTLTAEGVRSLSREPQPEAVVPVLAGLLGIAGVIAARRAWVLIAVGTIAAYSALFRVSDGTYLLPAAGLAGLGGSLMPSRRQDPQLQ